MSSQIPPEQIYSRVFFDDPHLLCQPRVLEVTVHIGHRQIVYTSLPQDII